VEGNLAGGDPHLLLGNPVSTSGYFFDAFGRNKANWTTFSISAFDTPNLKDLSLERLLKLSDAELDENVAPYLTTRRWVRKDTPNGSTAASKIAHYGLHACSVSSRLQLAMPSCR
jgi:hypothetical protein